ncbi:proprotein convertase subtilisin/kexin type 4-like isoform X1 [Dicentrarchus labrax]|uniref:P/Homo B domain-containing protein n=1 Tax=Dicentrarchus labrax TaxID=13489 RepID=A0A8C4EFE4_DICLA|nr:proprotein convertase subtilisin/kexin type 4-like isoform X1 [Dicentrarchus labrax]XP_051262849.1 proprotein convertase subtilisin/kexin type 4-like isoform X1 [Dicentrarchus labrax]
MFSAVVLVLGCLLQRKLVATEGHRGTNCHVFYAVQMDGGFRAARALAEQHGLEFIQRVGSLEGVYTLRDSRWRPDRATFESRLRTAAGVHWVQRQHSHYRDKRVPVTGPGHSSTHSSQRRESATDRQPEENKSDQSLTFNDPLWPMQWELFAQGEYNSSGFDLNVMPVWSNNITGNGVVVSIIDDGVDHANKDLKKNFEALASFDLCASHGLSHDPMPVRDEENSHGTRCAGEVAMEANNSYCGVGIAFNARIGGIRLLDGSVTDAMEATALTFNIHFIDIYVCSWGPRDDGAEMDGPHSLTERALRLGTHKGRGGKGSIFVWAAGNGGMQRDHCGADGYVNSIYNIAIGAVSQTGKPTYFGEPCPGVMAVTLTGAGVGGSLPLVTVTVTSISDGCVTHFPGTSSAAPIAAGILALVLEVNPNLTWRDVQHLIAETAKIPDPKEPGWNINGAGFHVHHRYGFGLLDAGLMVQQAVYFTSVAPQRKCTQEVTLDPTRVLSPGGLVSVNIQSEACHGRSNEINTLEHVQVRVSISTVCRGDLSISLASPAGTVSLLLDTRPNDASNAGLKNWTLMTVHCWGEQPRGPWTLQVTDHKGTVRSCMRPNDEEASGALLSVTLILYGTYLPHRTMHEGPLQSIVSMGLRHPVPQRGVYQRDGFPPLDLIQWVYQMERDRKVRADDITVPVRHKMLKIPDNKTFNKLLMSSMAFQLHQTDVAQKSSTGARPSAVKKLPETIRDNVDRESGSLPSQTLQGAVMDVKEVRQSDSSAPGGGETVSRKAGEGKGN